MPTVAGYLHKRSATGRDVRSQFFVLRGTTLRIFKNREDAELDVCACGPAQTITNVVDWTVPASLSGNHDASLGLMFVTKSSATAAGTALAEAEPIDPDNMFGFAAAPAASAAGDPLALRAAAENDLFGGGGGASSGKSGGGLFGASSSSTKLTRALSAASAQSAGLGGDSGGGSTDHSIYAIAKDGDTKRKWMKAAGRMLGGEAQKAKGAEAGHAREQSLGRSKMRSRERDRERAAAARALRHGSAHSSTGGDSAARVETGKGTGEKERGAKEKEREKEKQKVSRKEKGKDADGHKSREKSREHSRDGDAVPDRATGKDRRGSIGRERRSSSSGASVRTSSSTAATSSSKSKSKSRRSSSTTGSSTSTSTSSSGGGGSGKKVSTKSSGSKGKSRRSSSKAKERTEDASQEDAELWTVHTSPQGRTYYHCKATGASSWEMPPSLRAAEAKAAAKADAAAKVEAKAKAKAEAKAKAKAEREAQKAERRAAREARAKAKKNGASAAKANDRTAESSSDSEPGGLFDSPRASSSPAGVGTDAKAVAHTSHAASGGGCRARDHPAYREHFRLLRLGVARGQVAQGMRDDSGESGAAAQLAREPAAFDTAEAVLDNPDRILGHAGANSSTESAHTAMVAVRVGTTSVAAWLQNTIHVDAATATRYAQSFDEEGYDAADELHLDLVGGHDDLQRRFGLKEGHARRLARILAQMRAGDGSGLTAAPAAAPSAGALVPVAGSGVTTPGLDLLPAQMATGSEASPDSELTSAPDAEPEAEHKPGRMLETGPEAQPEQAPELEPVPEQVNFILSSSFEGLKYGFVYGLNVHGNEGLGYYADALNIERASDWDSAVASGAAAGGAENGGRDRVYWHNKRTKQVTWTKPAVVEDDEKRASEKAVESLVSDLPALSCAVDEPSAGKEWTDDEDDSGSSDNNDDFFSSSSDSDADVNTSNDDAPPQPPPAEPEAPLARPAEGSVAYHLQAAREKQGTEQRGPEPMQATSEAADGAAGAGAVAVAATATVETVTVDSAAEFDSNDSDASESDWD